MLRRLALAALLLPLAAEAASPVAAVSANRTSGKVPLLVYFDATATTDSDLTKPIHHLTYCFDAGDGNTDTYSQAGHKTTQKAKFCGAPGWAYVYETTGTHTMTLTVIDEQGNTDTATVNVTVNDWTAAQTTCVSTSGTFTGCPFTTGEGANHVTSSDFDAYATDRQRVLFRCGESFSVSATVGISTSTSMIGAYDNSGTVTNRRCRYTVTGSDVDPLISVGSTDDVRVMDGDDQSSTTGDFITATGSASADVDNLLVQNWVTNTNFSTFRLGGGAQAGSVLPSNVGFFSNNFQTCSTTIQNCIYTAITHLSFVDTILNNGAQHSHRLEHGEYAFIHNNKYSNNATDRHHLTIRGHETDGCYGGNANRWAQNVFVSDNYFEGNSAIVTELSADNKSCAGQPRHRNHIFERNYFTGNSNVQTFSRFQDLGTGTSENITVRNNICDMSNTASWAVCFDGSIDTGLEFLNNSLYSPDNSRGFMRSNCLDIKNTLSWDESGSQTTIDGTCTNSSGNADANGGEMGVADLSVCPFSSCPPTTVDHFIPITDGEAVAAGVSVPYRCDFGQEDGIVAISRDIGAWKQGTTTSTCSATATVAQQPGQNLGVNSVTP